MAKKVTLVDGPADQVPPPPPKTVSLPPPVATVTLPTLTNNNEMAMVKIMQRVREYLLISQKDRTDGALTIAYKVSGGNITGTPEVRLTGLVGM